MNDIITELNRIHRSVGSESHIADQVADLCDVVKVLAAKVQELERRLDWQDEYRAEQMEQG